MSTDTPPPRISSSDCPNQSNVSLPSFRPSQIPTYLKRIRKIGLLETAIVLAQVVRVKCFRCRHPISLRTRQSRHWLQCRPNASDYDVFRQIYIENDYLAFFPPASDVRLILDLGANVGYFSARLLTQYPRARLIAVEPDPENFAMLQKNLRPYGDRCRLLNAAVWAYATRLVLVEDPVHGAWATSVREAEPGEAAGVVAVDVLSLLEQSGSSRVDFLKVDIEGTEKILFGPGHETWLPRVDRIAIELHGGESTDIFMQAIAPHRFNQVFHGELMMCWKD